MQEWVPGFLMLARPETVSEESFREEINTPAFAWRRLTKLFHHNFKSDYMLELVGSVLADLPQDKFDRFVKSLPCFVLADHLGYCQRFHLVDVATMIVFDKEILGMDWLAARGVCIHEIVHAIRDDPSEPFCLDDPLARRLETECDLECMELGFEDEIVAVRKYIERRKKRNDER
jgi:hypothetical protein